MINNMFNTTITINKITLIDNTIDNSIHSIMDNIMDTSKLFVGTIKIINMIGRINIVVIQRQRRQQRGRIPHATRYSYITE